MLAGGPFAFVSDLPPVLQLGVVGFLGGFSALSVAGRVWPRIGRKIFDPDREPNSFEHLSTYTLVPLLLFGAAVVAVYTQWQPGRPLLDGMSPPLWRAAAGIVLGMGLSLTAAILKRSMDIDRADARKLSAWLPFGLLVAGVGLTAYSLLRLDRLIWG